MKKTTVRGIRASKEFWNRVKEVAEIKNTTVNGIIFTATNQYCDKVLTNKNKYDKL